MVTKKTTTKSVDELVGKPDKATAQEEKVEAKEAVHEVAQDEQQQEAPAKEVSKASDQVAEAPAPRPHKIHIGGDRGDRSGDNSQRQSYGGGHYQQQDTPTEEVKGFLDTQPEGHGFLRPKFIHSNRDIYISQSQIRRFMLRPGDLVEGVARPPKDTERYYGLLKVEKVNGISAEEAVRRPYFDDLTPIYPNKQMTLATGTTPLSTRMIDLIAPIGFGQRGMIVSPPKAGKTTILKQIAAGISENFPDVHLMAALIGERPEEVTDISMSVRGEVVASNFDEPPENQTRVAEITLDRAKRMVELGKDVVILLDSITRLARAYNLAVEPSGRTLSGGFDPAALHPAKRFFGAARNCQEGGSLTIIGTALVETGSRMDELIYEEFKGTGNMELHLDRGLAERRIFPAINITRSGTRGEERILSEEVYKKIVTMRRMMDMLGQDERTSIFVERLGKTKSNDEFLEGLGQG
ncbi:MAG TPA: transcription termination factor Rho [Candidatus Saccharimonadales bacterium]|nr:transcription termination factor Rho [Candidatus Saccharimonadales bacterium]